MFIQTESKTVLKKEGEYCGNFENEHQFGKCKHGLKCQIPKCKENGLCPKGNCVRIRK